MQTQTQTIKTELLINGRQVLVGHQFLEDIVRDIPDIKENKEVFNTLVLSDNPDVREYLTRVDNLSKKSVHVLLNDTNQEVVDGVLSNSDLAKLISEKALLKIIDSDNTKLLMTIASNVDDYVKCDLCKIIKILANHKSAAVRYNLLRCWSSDSVPIKILKQLTQDKDIDVAKEAAKTLERRI
ncbi:hypothetical protein JHD46_01925 [Sulfurimonas sp. SAG-AH-194-C20]|nr:hypothetical protein [Sulfurimonas sp. SAG-AH-194-C20]MDF1878393.1 hypothetical protein [Sulfurimonas sp. SAG-AH-194-C20]